jgi:hypothetical protein
MAPLNAIIPVMVSVSSIFGRLPSLVFQGSYSKSLFFQKKVDNYTLS